ncbi:hypothetical protein OAT22_05115 [Porticoccaceae bacterium]|nr:hypothetical protein [Porticoccaceae bacterium]
MLSESTTQSASGLVNPQSIALEQPLERANAMVLTSLTIGLVA